MKATVIVDNIGNEQVKGEWGLCILIEYEGKKVLLDVGGSGLFAENMEKLNLSLEELDYAVLSHAHYDHADGMRTFFEKNHKTKFFLRDGCQQLCYFKTLFVKKYIGIPKGILEEYSDRIEIVKGDYQISEGIYLIPHKTPGLEKIGKREHMYVKREKGYTPDVFSHEQSLVFETKDGLVIFNSCSHGGADNIIREVQETFPDKPVIAIIGGFHLFGKSEAFVRGISKRIRETGIKHVYTGHCTGKKAYQIMSDELGDMVRQLRVGLEITF